ncbi:MAG: hypothetical protein HYT08_03520 [Candidatus Levybacteria bacterium]|nr:hypothetical protein [Candidatus Levybacteria bacterium]
MSKSRSNSYIFNLFPINVSICNGRHDRVLIKGNSNRITTSDTSNGASLKDLSDKSLATVTPFTKLVIFIKDIVNSPTYSEFLLKTILPVGIYLFNGRSPPFFN